MLAGRERGRKSTGASFGQKGNRTPAVDTEAALAALYDAARRLLRTAAEEPHTAGELIETCSIRAGRSGDSPSGVIPTPATRTSATAGLPVAAAGVAPAAVSVPCPGRSGARREHTGSSRENDTVARPRGGARTPIMRSSCPSDGHRGPRAASPAAETTVDATVGLIHMENVVRGTVPHCHRG
ncbi:hypothetical protein BRC88_09715 [Halobacteriales archaeon QS_4_69_225]|nr:MAG: hypothetical protein BRC88_09715 [Halobacteriales archaeon QS_4_69_225]